MRRTVVGALLVVTGAIWLLQGLNAPFVPRSFMTASPIWIVIGAVTVVVGTAVALSGRRHR